MYFYGLQEVKEEFCVFRSFFGVRVYCGQPLLQLCPVLSDNAVAVIRVKGL